MKSVNIDLFSASPSSSDKSVKVWDAGSRACINTFFDHQDQVKQLFQTCSHLLCVLQLRLTNNLRDHCHYVCLCWGCCHRGDQKQLILPHQTVLRNDDKTCNRQPVRVLLADFRLMMYHRKRFITVLDNSEFIQITQHHRFLGSVLLSTSFLYSGVECKIQQHRIKDHLSR